MVVLLVAFAMVVFAPPMEALELPPGEALCKKLWTAHRDVHLGWMSRWMVIREGLQARPAMENVQSTWKVAQIP